MSEQSQVVILCEDRQQECFIRYFLLERGWNKRNIRSLVSPKGKSAGEQWVRQEFPKELRAYRSVCNHKALIFIAAIDADTKTEQERIQQLEVECKNAEIPFRSDSEQVLILTPKRNIETWIAYLCGDCVDEEKNYKRHGVVEQSACRPQVQKLSQRCRAGQLTTPPSSLMRACQEWKRI